MSLTVTEYCTAKSTAATMNRYRLKRLLKRHGIGPVHISRLLGIPSGHSAVSQWFANRCESARIEAVVRAEAARVLGDGQSGKSKK